MSEPKHKAIWFPVFRVSHLSCFGALMRGSAIKTLFWGLLCFLKETSRYSNGIHRQAWTVILCYKSLPTNTEPVFLSQCQCAGYAKTHLQPMMYSQPKALPSTEEKKGALPPQEREILFEILAVYFQLFLPSCQTTGSWQDVQRHRAATRAAPRGCPVCSEQALKYPPDTFISLNPHCGWVWNLVLQFLSTFLT